MQTLIERVDSLEKRIHGMLTALEGTAKHIAVMVNQMDEINKKYGELYEAVKLLSDNMENINKKSEECKPNT